jgi:hypothetical protein
MAFEYGESYYGLRSWGSSAGDVKDASASLTATCTIPAVGFAVAIGMGGATTTVTASASCSGEVVIIERIDEFAYGMGSYGINAFTQGDLQTVVTATSSVSAEVKRVRESSATASAASSISCVARRIPEGSVLIEGSSQTSVNSTGNGTRTRTSGATASPTSAITSVGFATRGGSATSSAVASLTGSGVFVVSIAVTLPATSSVAAICNKVRFGSGTPTANASIAVLGFATRGGIASSIGTATVVSDSEQIFQGHAVTQPESSILATCNRVQSTSGALSATSGVATIGREKWEIITNDSVTWTQIAA